MLVPLFLILIAILVLVAIETGFGNLMWQVAASLKATKLTVEITVSEDAAPVAISIIALLTFTPGSQVILVNQIAPVIPEVNSV